MAVKLFVSDLDGTMLPSRSAVSPENVAAVRRAAEAGVVVTIATGRMFEAALPVAEALGLDVPIISYNGALIKSPSGRVYEEHTLDAQLARDIIMFCHARDWYIQEYSGGQLRYEKACDESRAYEASQGVPGLAVGRDGMLAHAAGNCKLLLATRGREITIARAEEVRAAFGAQVDVTRSADTLVEIVPKGISKASALARGKAWDSYRGDHGDRRRVQRSADARGGGQERCDGQRVPRGEGSDGLRDADV